MTYKRIMVAIDDGKTSKNALLEAILLAKTMKSKLCIIYVADEFSSYELIPYGVDFEKLQESIREQGRCLLTKMKKLSEKKGVTAEIRLVENTDGALKISERIIEAAKKWKSHLLVMGTQGRRGLNRLIIGSVAESALRITPIPILLVHGKE